MYRCGFVFAAVLSISANAMAVLVDDFDSYALGQVDTVTTNWKGTADVTIETDPTDPQNRVIRVWENTGTQKAVYGVLSSEASIPEAATKTLFLRFRATSTIDSAFGLTNVDAPDVGGNNWGQFGPQVSVLSGDFRVRDSGTWRVARSYTALQWYNLWMVVDNATDTMKVYLHDRADEPATEADRITVGAFDTFGYRNAIADTLDRFYWRAQNPGGDRWVWIDDIYLMEGASLSNPLKTGMALSPMPSNRQTDVPREAGLSWTASEDAATHDVYFGTSFEDVNSASRANPLSVLVSQGLTATAFDPEGVLAFSQTYYWRVDGWEADGVTMHKGDVWSFTVAPLYYTVEDVVACASLPTADGSGGPEVTVDGTGLTDGLHGTGDTTMWSGKAVAGDPVWLQFDFDRVYKLYQMHVWNYNGLYEMWVGFGLKDVTIEYAAEPNEWMTLGDYVLDRATSSATYAGQVIELDGLPARSIRINVHSNRNPQGELQYGLSEIQFLYKPVFAREPQPADGETGVGINTALGWRAGREAASHQVYLSNDSNAVAEDTALFDTVTVNSRDLRMLDLGTTYYWKIVEVNDAETPTAWAGDIWSFSTSTCLLVDGFEDYTDDLGEEIFMTWEDGYGDDSNGSQVGNDDPPYAVPENIHSGSQAMPVRYGQNGAATSEATMTLPAAEDWTEGAATTLTLYFYGDPDNSADEPMWVRLTDQSNKTGTVTYGTGAAESVDNQTIAAWHEWSIPLADFGVDLTQIKSMAIGFGGTGPRSAGVMIFDDIRLYPTPAAAPAVLAGYWALDGDATDGSGNGNDGTRNGGATWVAAGKIGGALSVNGTDGYVDCGNGESLNITDAITLSAWVNTNDASNAEHNPFVAKGDHAYAIKHSVDDQIQTFVYDGGWRTANYTIDPSFNGEWHHVASTYDGVTLRLYLDGILRATTEYVGSIASTTYNVNIGRNAENADRFYNGLIDEVRIYHGALSPAEIVQLSAP
ncbi:MAG: LamG domain-containing protein [Sedimentisphaerales bacterium]|nr:LamG domain-containing protein [Sedimentisphaerales bacterium]